MLQTVTREEYINTVLPLKNKLFGYSFKMLHSRQEAEDVVQDVLVKVWETRNSQQTINNLEAWCMTMTRNKSLDKLKLKSRNSVEIESRFDLATDDSSPFKVVEMNDLKKKLRKVVDTLPLKQREVVQLRDFQGRTYQEISDMMGIDMNLVKVTLHRARQVIKKEILKLSTYGLESS